jgi:hypothetical protein
MAIPMMIKSFTVFPCLPAIDGLGLKIYNSAIGNCIQLIPVDELGHYSICFMTKLAIKAMADAEATATNFSKRLAGRCRDSPI